MANETHGNGILIDVGFATEGIKEYIANIEKELSNLKWEEKIGLSDAFNAQVKDAEEKIKELKNELQKIGEGRLIDKDLQKAFKTLTDSVTTLQNQFKILVQTAPKNKQSGMLSQLAQISSELQEVSEVTKNTANVFDSLSDKKVINSEQLKDLAALYKELERARQASEKFDKTRKKSGNDPYIDTDEILRDIKAQYELYLDLDGKIAEIQDKDKISKKDEDKVARLNARITESITNVQRLINTMAGMNEKWGKIRVFEDDPNSTLNNISQEMSSTLTDMLDYIAKKKVEIQKEFTDLGGSGDLADQFKQSTNKKSRITLPVIVAPGAKKEVLDECINLVTEISKELENTPIKATVQLVTKYQSDKNEALIKELQSQISKVEAEARQAVADGTSEAEAAELTKLSENMQALLTRLNKQIDNAMLFTVRVNVGVAQNVIKSFVSNAKAKLKELEKNPPDIEPGFTLTDQAKKQFLKEVNAFIQATNKQIEKLQVEKSKMGNDVFSTYINQLKSAIRELKGLIKVLGDKSLFNQEISKNAKEFQSIINDVDETVGSIYSTIEETFNPDNLNNWANKLLATLDEAIQKAQEIKPTISETQNSNTESTIFNAEDKKKIQELTKVLQNYRKARDEYNTLFDDYINIGFDDVTILEKVNLPKSLRNKLEKGLISEEEIAAIYEQKFQNAFNKLSKLLPNIDIDNLDTVVDDIFNTGAFKSIEEASEELYKALSKNLDISSIIRQKASKFNLNSLLDEINAIKQAYTDNTWRNSFAFNPNEDYITYSQKLQNEIDASLEPEDMKVYLDALKDLLPYINKAYEEINGKPAVFSEEQNNILDQLKNEELTLEQILELWNKLNIQVEKGVLLKGNKVASQTVLGDLSNVSFESLNNRENGIYGKFDTILHSHANGMGTFSPEDIQLVLDNWKAGVRKLLLLVDGELQEIDFTSVKKNLVVKFQKEFASVFQNAISESIVNGVNPLNNNEVFSKIKGDVFNSLLSQYGLNLTTSKVQSVIKDTNQTDIFDEQKTNLENGLDEIKKKIFDDIKQLYEELYKVLDPKNIDPWAEKLLSTLNQATDKIRTMFVKDGGINELSLFLDDIAYSDQLKQENEGNDYTLEHGGVLLKSGKVIGLTSTGEHGKTRYSNPIYHLKNGIKEEDIASSVHTHSGDFLWMPSKADLENAMIRELDYAITSTLSEIATFNVDAYKKDNVSDKINLDKLDNYIHQNINNKLLSDSIKKLFNNNIDLISKSDRYNYLKYNSQIKNANQLTNKEFITEAFKQAFESKPTSELDFWNQIIKNIGEDAFPTDQAKMYEMLDELTGHVFHLKYNPNMGRFHSRTSYLSVYQDRLKQYFADNGVDFNKYFSIQSHEDFKNNAPFGLDKILTQSDSAFNIGNFASNINDIINNINKLGGLNISDNFNLQVDAQILNDIKANLEQIVQLLQTLPNIVGNISLTPFDTEINKLKADLLGLESSGKGAGDKDYDALTKQIEDLQKKRQTYINQLIKSAATSETKKDNKKTTEEEQLQKATENYNKYYNNIYKRFNQMLQQNGQELIEATIEPTKKGLIEINALIKNADNTYKSFIYTTKTGLGKNPFTLEKTKEGFSVNKVAAAYEKWIEVQEELKKDPQMIGDVTPNTVAWNQLVDLAEKFGLEMKDIDRIVRNVDREGFESFQFFDKLGNRTTLGINSESKLFENKTILQVSKDIKNFKKEVADLPKLFQQGITNYDSNASIKYIDNLKEILELWKRIDEYKNLGQISDEDYNNLKASFSNTSTTIESIVGAKISTSGKTDDFINDVNNSNNALETFLQNITSMSTQDAQRQLEALINKFRELYKTQNDPGNKVAKETATSKLLAKIGDELTRNSSMSQKYKDELNAIVQEMQALGKSIPQDKFNEFTNRFQDIISKVRLAGQSGKGLFDNLGQSITRSIGQFANMYLSVYRLVGYIKQGVTEVKNLDKALTTISYTMNVTNNQLQEMGNDILAMAKDLSISVDNVSQIYQIYANMQTTSEEMMQTAKPTAILANLSGVDAATAADQIQGVINQFDLAAESSMHIADVYNYISSNISVDYSKGIAGMADAVRNVGNVAKDAGLSFEQLSAIIGKVMERTRQDGSSIGNALRTIFVRVSKASKLAGDEVDNATLSNASKALHKIGIEVYTAQGEFREFDTIMGELAAKWDTLSDAEQANISFQIAATRQTSMLRAILAEYTDAMELATQATLDEGSALANQEKYEESITGKTQALSNEFSKFWINTINSDNIKEILDELLKLVSSLNDADSTAKIFVNTVSELLKQILQIVNVVNKFPGGVFGVLFGLTKGKNKFANLSQTGGIDVSIGKLFNANILKKLSPRKYTDTDISLFQNYLHSNDKDDLIGLSNNAQQLVNSYDNVIDKQDEIINQMKTATVTTKALTAARLALNVAMSVGLSLIASSLIQEVYKLIHAEENLKKDAQETGNAFKRLESEIDNYKTQIGELTDKLDDNNLSTKKSAEYRNDLYNIQKKMIEQYGSEAESIGLITKAIHGEIDALDELKRKKWEETEKKFNKEHDSITDKSMGPLDWFIALFSQNETNAKVVSTYFGGNIHKSASQIAYENWLEGDNEYADIAEQYFQYNVLEKEFKDQYDELKKLEAEYSEKLANDELTPDLEKYYADKSNEIAREIAGSNDNVLEAIYSVFDDLKTNRENYRYNVEQSNNIQKQAKEIFATDLFKREVKDWLRTEKELFDKFGVDTQEELDALTDAIDEAKKDSIWDINEVFDLYQQRLDEIVQEQRKYKSLTSWLQETSEISNGKDSNYNRNELINTFESSLGAFDEYITNIREGKVNVDLSRLINVTSDPASLYQQLHMENFEEYVAKYGNDFSAIDTYIRDMRDKVMRGFGELDTESKQALIKMLNDIENKALGISSNVDTIDESYAELKDLLKDIQNGKSFKLDELDQLNDLLVKFPELTDAVKKNDNGTFSIYEENIKSLITEYGKLYNSEASYTYFAVKNALERTIAISMQGATLEGVLETYDELNKVIGGADNIHYQKRFGAYTDEIVSLIRQYREADKDFQAIKDGNDSSGKDDKDNKSQYDWLDSYLDKRNRALQKEQTLYDNLAKNDPIDLIKDRLKEYQKGGNVNLLLRPEIDTEELKKAKWDDIEDGIATVYSKTFSNKAKDIAINFTPIIVDPVTGEYQGVMSPKKFDKYCEDVIAGVRKDDLNLQIGAAFTGKNAIAEAEKAAIDIHLLHQQLMNDYSIEERYYTSLNTSLEEQNNLLDEKIAAYTRANEEYEKVRMHDNDSLLYKNLVDAFGGSKSKANAIIQKIINRESVELTEYTSDQASAISAIADTFNKALDAEDTILEAQYQIHDNILKQHSNDIELITKQYDHVLNEFANRQAELEHYQTMRTNAGMMENQKYYIALLDNESRELEANIQKRDELINKIQDMNPITEDELELWWDTKNAIDETTKSIWESQEAIESYQMSMKQLSWDLNDRIRDITGNLRNETDFLIDTLGTFEKDMYSYERQYLGNDAEKTKIYNGQMSAEGLSTLALRRVRAKSFREDIDAINDEIEEARADYMSNTANTTYLDRLNDLIGERQSLIESYNSEREAIVQLVDEGYQKQLESLDAITNKYIEALQAEKD